MNFTYEIWQNEWNMIVDTIIILRILILQIYDNNRQNTSIAQ